MLGSQGVLGCVRLCQGVLVSQGVLGRLHAVEREGYLEVPRVTMLWPNTTPIWNH